MYKGSPVYLRDLNPDMQRETIYHWESEGRKDLIKANENGIDIVVGHYVQSGEEEIEG